MSPISILTANPDETLLCLKKNVLYIALADGPINATTPPPIWGKVIFINNKQTFKPNNYTAALLLTLLTCDSDEPVLFSDFLTHTKAKFTDATDANITAFLDKLDTTYKILKIRTGSSATNDPDPLNLFGSPQWNWAEPDLIETNPPICKTNTFYSDGYWPVVVPR
jgi:hypothetical protein